MISTSVPEITRVKVKIPIVKIVYFASRAFPLEKLTESVSEWLVHRREIVDHVGVVIEG